MLRVTPEEAALLRRWCEARDRSDDLARIAVAADAEYRAAFEALRELDKQVMALATDQARSFLVWEKHIVTVSKGEIVPRVTMLERL